MSQYADDITVRAGADLNGAASQYKAIAVGGTIAAANTATMGLLQNKPKSNEHASLRIVGRSFYVAGAAVVAGAALKVTTSGYLITVASGDLPCGKAFEAVTSGSTGEGYFNFATAKSNPGA